MKRLIVMSLAVAMLLTVSLVPLRDARAVSWYIEGADTPRNFQQSAIALHSSNNPHIVYGGDGLYYAYYNGASWNYETADPSPGVGKKVAIGLDGMNKAHIAYYDAINDQIRYATNSSGVWQSAVVDSNGDSNATISVAVEPLGKVHISYYHRSNHDLMYATNTPNSLIFTTEVIDGSDPGIDSGYDSSIDVDATGKVHIAYFYALNVSPWYGIKYTSGNSGSWATPQSVATGWYERPSVVIDSVGKAHISYFDVPNRDLRYATNKTDGWTYEKIDGDTNDVGWFSSIALYNDIPRVVYYDATARGVRYAYRGLSTWTSWAVENASWGAAYASMAIDSTGKAHTSYLSDTEVRYAKQTPPSWSIATVDTRELVGINPSIAVDDNGYLHVSYTRMRPSYGNIGWDLKYATNTSGAWQAEAIEIGYVNDHSIDVDSTGKVHIAYRRSNEGLKYATGNFGSWSKELIHSSTSTTVEEDSCSIGVDSTGKVHISYFFGKSGESNLEYAVGNFGSWFTERIEEKADNNSSVGYSNSLTVEAPGDIVRIVYGYYNSGSAARAIKMATGNYGWWSMEEIYSGTSRSLDSALDAEGNTHVSFIDTSTSPGRLMYITNASSTPWEPVVIDAADFVVPNTSIGVDSSYYVHISYYVHAPDYDLRYATNSSGSWQNEMVDGPGNVGYYHDLAVDSLDAIHIVYHDWTNGDLDHAYTQVAPIVTSLSLTAVPINVTADGTSISTLAATVEDQFGDPAPDGNDVVFTTNHGTFLGSSSVTKQTSGGIATATLTSVSGTETIIATVTATANGASDAAAVFFIPMGGVEVSESQTETVTDSGTVNDTLTGGDVSIVATGDHNITIAKYADNPGDTPTFQATGEYYDVHLDNDTSVNSLSIEFCPATAEMVIYHWNGLSWLAASEQYYDPVTECVMVTITDSTSPSLSDLAGLVFASGVSVIPFEIDIKPGSDPNSINCNNEKGVITVAVLTTEDFDATTVDHTTVTFEGGSETHVDKISGEPRRHEEDVDGDGDIDLVSHFRLGDTQLTCDSTEGTLTGETFDGQAFEGTDSVRMVEGGGA
jgi:hypothetical protein